eukprot:TRINITY_DN64580_c0_g1_i1.p1 TRINITY_DN64580_c0_g1~~TRINITY_DN64580_c0_g1_i1.p1  ORF type:complete len:342 (-),score=58.27 TRINITY_DN64580_c0_g1_i1:50-1075(-)
MFPWRSRSAVHLLLVIDVCLGDVLRLCAFNVQVFGRSKMSKPGVAEVLAKVVRRCDVMLIQEIRDSSSEAIQELLSAVNAEGDDFEMFLSPRLGRSTSKEQYGFFFRKSEVVLTPKYLVEGKLGAAFARPPYIVEVLPRHAASWRSWPVGLIPLHATPKKVFEELSSLEGVYSEYAKKSFLGRAAALVLGDLNAGCGYLSSKKKEELSMPHFQWYIDDDADTTTGKSVCPYDRFLAAGPAQSMILKGSASVFRFDAEYGLDASSALDVSDHYPIEILLQWPNADLELALPVALLLGGSIFLLGLLAGYCKAMCKSWRSSAATRQSRPVRSQALTGIALRQF